MIQRKLGTALPLSAPIALYVLLYATWTTAHLFLPDDAFYYFEIARNIAAGKGSTFDGLNRTNGYHPLWCGLLAVLGMAPLSKDGFVTAALALQGALLAWAVVALFRSTVRRETRPSGLALFAAFAWLGNFYVSKTLLNGMESALLAATSVLLVSVASGRLVSSRPLGVGAGALMGGLFSAVLMSRLDSVFLLVAIVTLWVAMRRDRLRAEVPALAALVAVPLVTLAVYMAANRWAFGLAVPVSGYLKRVVNPTPRTLSCALAFLPVVAFVVGAYRWAGGKWLPHGSRKHTAYALFTLNVLMLQGDSMLVRGEAVPAIWYLAQHALWALATLWLAMEKLASRRWIATAILGVASAGAVWSWALRLSPASYAIYLQRREMSGWMNERLPETAVVAGWDVGITGYYCDLPVVNLDGLVNSYEYAQSMQRGEGVAYLDRLGVTHLAQAYLVDFDHFKPRGYDRDELHRRAGRVIWSVESAMRPVGGFVRDYLRTGKSFPMEVRVYTSPGRVRSEPAIAGVDPVPAGSEAPAKTEASD